MLRRAIISLFVLLAASNAGRAQIRVGAGESWTYEFTSLPSVGLEPALAGGPSGGTHVTLSGFEPTDHYTLEIFEDSLPQPPLWLTDSAVNQSGSAGNVSIWQDLQGWVRLKVLAGEVFVDQVQFDTRIPVDASTVDHYQAIIPIPEPATLHLMLMAGSLAVANTFRRWSRTRR